MSKCLFAFALVVWLCTTLPAHTQTLGTPGSEILFLVTDCEAAGHLEGNECFESVSALQTKVWGTGAPGTGGIDPNAGNPLIVDIGPGVFPGRLMCENGGWVTFRGAGRDRTRIHAPNSFGGALNAVDCQQISVQDLALSSVNIGVFFAGSSTSNFSDVDITGGFAGWYDQTCGGSPDDPPAGEHFFWGVKFEGEIHAFFAECARSWMFGSDLVTRPIGYPTFGGDHLRGIRVAHRAEVHLFGSNVEVTTAATTSTLVTDATAVWVGTNPNQVSTGYGRFEMQGGRILVDASNLSGVDVVALNVHDQNTGNASARVLETDFQLMPGSNGTATRLTGDGTIGAPLLWPSGTVEPASASLTGQDLFVDTDCADTGCDTIGSEPHLLILSSTCTSKWFDVVTGACKP